MASHPRIAFTGNIGNAHYAIAVALRDAGIEAHLFIGADDPLAWRPETDEPSLAGAYPDWIHEGHWYGRANVATPWRAPLVEAVRSFDMVVASGSTPAFVHFADIPTVFFSMGGDLTVRPFPITFRKLRGGLLSQASHAVLSAWQRRAIRQADQIWTQPFAPFMDAIDRLGIDRGRVADAYFPLIVDTTTFTPDRTQAREQPWVQQATDGADFVVFSPTRLVFAESPEMRRSGQWKGSQTLLDAFAEFVRREVADFPVLVLPDWVLSNDVADAKHRVVEMGIADHVRFVTPPRPEGFNRSELVDLYNAADVAVDEFGSGWFGFVSLEAMACGTPVVSRIDEPAIRTLYGDDWCWLSAPNASDAANRFETLARDREFAHDLGTQARSWIERHHSATAATSRYVQAVTDSVAELVT
ncbi:MAG: glycosyltransferase family 4 protein [Actinomycetota bacterium]